MAYDSTFAGAYGYTCAGTDNCTYGGAYVGAGNCTYGVHVSTDICTYGAYVSAGNCTYAGAYASTD